MSTQAERSSKKYFHLGRNRYVYPSTFKGIEYIHIRIYEKYSSSDKLFPTKTGIAFPLMRFQSLCFTTNLVDEAILKKEEVSQHLGGNVSISTNKDFQTVDIRHFFLLKDKLQATKKGINLRFSEWENLKKFIDIAEQYTPSLSQTFPWEVIIITRKEHIIVKSVILTGYLTLTNSTILKMAQQQVRLLMRKKGMTVPISNTKSIKVCDENIKLECVYGKTVKKSYVISFTYEEWILVNRKLVDCCQLLGLEDRLKTHSPIHFNHGISTVHTEI